jgi:DNA topoisomerase II
MMTQNTKTLKQDSTDIQPRRIKTFLNNEVKDYAQYVIRTRAMPNIMDGLRVGARKIIWAALTGDLSKKTKPVKMPSLIGDTMKLHYNHGDASLMNTIIQLCSKHIYKYAPLEVIGQIGSLRVPKCDTAPRYLHIKQSPYIDLFKIDSELFELEVEDGEKLEPKYFLPILPIALMWRTNSPGFGFSFRSFSYSVDSIIDNCIKSISQGSCNSDTDEIPLVPVVAGIDTENMVWNANKNSWYNIGSYIMNHDNDTILITDLPYDVNFEKFEEHLQLLIDRNYIVAFTDLSIDGKIKYLIQFAKGRLKLLSQDKWKFYQNLKLYSKVKQDTLNLIDEDGKTILFFDSPYVLIDTFVKKRLKFYDKRKIKTISVLKAEIQDLTNKIKFINLVTSDTLIINKRKIVDIKKELDSYTLPYNVLKLNIDKLTIDEIKDMESEIKELQAKLDYIINTPIQEMYILDLIDLKTKLSAIVKK